MVEEPAASVVAVGDVADSLTGRRHQLNREYYGESVSLCAPVLPQARSSAGCESLRASPCLGR
jgi:hypothetical protein